MNLYKSIGKLNLPAEIQKKTTKKSQKILKKLNMILNMFNRKMKLLPSNIENI